MTEVIKKQSFVLANVLSKFGIRIQHSVALEVLAQLNGAKNWNVFAAQGKHFKSLTEAHKVLLEQCMELRARTYGAPKSDGEIVWDGCAGDAEGVFLHMSPFNPANQWEVDGAYTRLAFEGLEDTAQKRATFLFLKLIGRAGKWEVLESIPVTKAELRNHTVTLTLERHNAYARVQCPLTRVVHKAGLGTIPFVEGSPYPVFEFIVPDRIWNVAQAIDETAPFWEPKPEHVQRIVVTVGELAACFEKNLSEGIVYT